MGRDQRFWTLKILLYLFQNSNWLYSMEMSLTSRRMMIFDDNSKIIFVKSS